jgi:hypothetical protein
LFIFHNFMQYEQARVVIDVLTKELQIWPNVTDCSPHLVLLLLFMLYVNC